MSDIDRRDTADPFAVEISRLLGVLAAMVEDKGASVRSLEKKMGVADSLFAKVLKGKITLQMRHVLMICTAAGIEWKDFFAAAYGVAAAPVAAPPVAEEVSEEVSGLSEAWMEEKMIDLLLRLGLVDSGSAARLIREGLSRGRSGAGESAGAG